jgi:putative oxidoreductase
MIYLFLFARILFGGYFLYKGILHFTKRAMFTQYAASKKVPAPTAAVFGTGAMLVVGGLSLLLAVYPGIGLWVIAAYLVCTTPIMHNFWSASDPSQRTIETAQFLKNVALLGAALMMVVFSYFLGGSWPFHMAQ